MSDLLSGEWVGRLVGVIDLLRGRAVHAVAGQRDKYRAVSFCDGNPLALVDHYRDLGLSSLYVADLDAIQRNQMQTAAIDAICDSACGLEILVDVGWTGDRTDKSREAIAHLTRKHPLIRWITATESCRSDGAIAELAEVVSCDRVMLGLDYRNGQLLSEGVEEDQWVKRAMEVGCHGAVILDLASVGTAQGPTTMTACTRVRKHAPHFSIYSGGGIRAADDLRLLIRAGCDRCLVATALYDS